MDNIFTIATTAANSQTSTAAMYSYISQFFGGTLDPTWPHVVLIAGTIIGGVLVGIGVILEAPKIFSVPVAAVFVGIVIEAACTLLLFGFDEGISSTQQSKIVELENRLAERTLTADQQRGITNAFAKFPPLNFSMVTYPGNPESVNLARQIESALKSANWTPVPASDVILGVEAGVYIVPNKDICDEKGNCSEGTPIEEFKMGRALVMGLRAAKIGAAVAPAMALQVKPTRIAISIHVGIKP